MLKLYLDNLIILIGNHTMSINGTCPKKYAVENNA